MEKHSQKRLTSEHIPSPPDPRGPGLGTRNFGHYTLRDATASTPGDSWNLPLQSHLHLHCLSHSISVFYVCRGTPGRELSQQDTTVQDAFPQGWRRTTEINENFSLFFYHFLTHCQEEAQILPHEKARNRKHHISIIIEAAALLSLSSELLDH